ncbi:MAG: hypothetical protein LUQ11_04045 [Methylococcaceae bacterium]|nr:hypothetical protein [Methylococcaceae bacterium]
MTKRPFFIKTINPPVSALILTLGMAFGVMSGAQATGGIASANGTSDCAACHGGNISKSTGKAGISGFCKSKYPAGTGAYNSSFVCTPAAAPTPTPAPKPTPAPGPNPTPTPGPTPDPTCNESTAVPTLTAPQNVSVNAGQQLTLAVTAFDCADREVTIKAKKGLPKGAKITNGFDNQLQLPNAVITWTPSANAQAQTINVTLVATVRSDRGRTVSSPSKTVSIQVLPANNNWNNDDGEHKDSHHNSNKDQKKDKKKDKKKSHDD